jgi:hypothetical protein
MAYFYSEKGMRFFVLLLALLLGWLFMGVSRAAFSTNARLPEDAGSVMRKLCPVQVAGKEPGEAVLLLKAFTVQEEK